MEKLKRQLAEAEAAVEARKRPPAETVPPGVGEGLVIDEWVRRSSLFHRFSIFSILFLNLVSCLNGKSEYYLYAIVFFIKFHLYPCNSQKERREKYLARQQVEAVEST